MKKNPGLEYLGSRTGFANLGSTRHNKPNEWKRTFTLTIGPAFNRALRWTLTLRDLLGDTTNTRGKGAKFRLGSKFTTDRSAVLLNEEKLENQTGKQFTANLKVNDD